MPLKNIILFKDHMSQDYFQPRMLGFIIHMEIGCIHLKYAATTNGLPPILKFTSNSKVGELTL
jgi:hypothetical protein